MKTYVTKWLLLGIACVILLTVIALWGWWERAPAWGYPVAVAVSAWLYLAGATVLSRIRGWRSYVSTITYMEAIEDGLCRDRPIHLGGTRPVVQGTRFPLATTSRTGIHAGASACRRLADAVKLEQGVKITGYDA
ncbi:MAG: hypothetical protein WCA85_02495 [Paraburkholderia sp.]|uniref:hypothetical protein n=1 Tax=Paraburkholderia sp. TaxID=1926495 RepID=UPI003C4A8C31